MAWDLVCRTEKEGGLGITGCLIWNEAVVAKYVWNMAQKEDNLWVRWVDHIYIKGSDWWQYVIPKDSCWYWKKICHIRDRFIPGHNQNGWLKPDGKYTIASRYTWRRGEIAEWLWYRWIWGKGILPKHSFICWLSLHERFLTKERLYRMGICQEQKCQLCGEVPETVKHIYFECPFSKKCILKLLQWLGKGTKQLDYKGIWRRLDRSTKGRECRLGISSIGIQDMEST